MRLTKIALRSLTVKRIEAEFQDNVRVVHGFSWRIVRGGAEEFEAETKIETQGDIIMAGSVNPNLCRPGAACDMAKLMDGCAAEALAAELGTNGNQPIPGCL